MATLLYRLGRWSYRHFVVVILAWVVLLGGVAGVALTQQKGFNDLFEISDVPSTHATDLLLRNFPDAGNPAASASVSMVFAAPEGQRLDDPASMAAMDRTVAAVKETVPQLGDTLQLHNPVTMNEGIQREVVAQSVAQGLPEETARADAHTLRTVSDDGRIGVATFSFDVPLPADVTAADRAAVEAAADLSREAGLTVEIGGPGFGDPVEVEPISETAGVLVALVILVFTLGSLIAAGLPIITAIVGIGIGTLLIVGVTALVPLNSMTPTLGLMLGLAVGIDYALFIMSRYRSELAAGREREEAVAMACGTAGSSVVFAGLTVIIALLGLRVADIPFLSWMGYAAAANVAIAVVIALTFLPALLRAAGGRIFRKEAAAGAEAVARADVDAEAGARGGVDGGVDGGAGTKGDAGAGAASASPIAEKWIRLVYRVPGLAFSVVTVALALLTLPALNLQLALPNDSTANVNSTQRRSAELLAEGFGPGRNSPFLVVVDAHDVAPGAAALTVYERNGATPQQAAQMYTAEQMRNNIDVEHAQIVGLSPDGGAAQVLVTPRTGPIDRTTVDLIHALRAQQAEIEAETGADLGITGFTVIQQDVTDRLEQTLPIYLTLVVGLALVLLLMVFRSVLVPLMAAGGFLLSVGAAFGVTVLVWQEGLWGLWSSPGPLISFMPIFLIGVTFGLAMDYQVFIVSRMRERFTHPGEGPQPGLTPTEDSVIFGFGLGAKVVTAAALIMIGVFASFVFQPLPFVQIFGFALGAGVLFDAFFVRMTLIPALMVLCGRATWAMPRWLDRIVPTVDVEGHALSAAPSPRNSAP